MQDEQAFPWHPSLGNQGTDYMQDEQYFPWHPSLGNQGTDYMEDKEALLVTLIGIITRSEHLLEYMEKKLITNLSWSLTHLATGFPLSCTWHQ